MTARNALRPIRWIGERSYLGRFVAANPGLLPICFKAGSLADNVPARDLHVSPKHAMYLDGMLIPAECLLNDVSITRAARADRVDYLHIELDSHDVILAEGAPSETFLDDGSRAMFHNFAGHAGRLPSLAPTHPVYYAPRVEHGGHLEAVRRRLAVRAGIAGSGSGF